jgi:hypothetical protein
MCCLINKIKNWFSRKKESENPFLKKASLSKEEVDNIIINSLKNVKQQKKTKTKVKVKSKKTKR